MSRAEIVAAAHALRKQARRRMNSEAFADVPRRGPAASSFVATCAERVLAEPTYRRWLVERLHARIHAGTYTPPADAIAEQLVGRLVAAALRT